MSFFIQLCVWSSTMRRARQTAAEIDKSRYVEWRALREIEVGVCDGLTYAQVTAAVGVVVVVVVAVAVAVVVLRLNARGKKPISFCLYPAPPCSAPKPNPARADCEGTVNTRNNPPQEWRKGRRIEGETEKGSALIVFSGIFIFTPPAAFSGVCVVRPGEGQLPRGVPGSRAGQAALPLPSGRELPGHHRPPGTRHLRDGAAEGSTSHHRAPGIYDVYF